MKQNHTTNHTLRAGELSSSDATTSWVATSGFHCKTEHRLLFESEKLIIEKEKKKHVRLPNDNDKQSSQ